MKCLYGKSELFIYLCLAVYKHVFNYRFVLLYMQTLSQVLDGIPTYATQLKINVGVHARRGGDGML